MYSVTEDGFQRNRNGNHNGVLQHRKPGCDPSFMRGKSPGSRVWGTSCRVLEELDGRNEMGGPRRDLGAICMRRSLCRPQPTPAMFKIGLLGKLVRIGNTRYRRRHASVTMCSIMNRAARTTRLRIQRD